MEQNTVNNCVTGVWVDHGSTLALNSNLLFLDNNTVSADANGYCNNGIFVSDWASTVVPGSWEIYGNIINEAATGIFLQNVKKPTASPSSLSYNVQNNSITTKAAAFGNINGIKANGCIGVAINNNHTKYTSGSNLYLSGTNQSAYGIYLQNSQNMLVSCNQIDDAYRSLVFDGTCTSVLSTNTSPSIGVTQNTMHNAYDGFVLKSTAIIGSQGSSTVASDNYWDAGSTFTNSETFTETSGANTNSPLFMNTGNAPFPSVNLTGTGFPADIYTFSSSNYSSGTIISCGYVPALAPPSSSGYRSAVSTNPYTNELIAMVLDTTQLPVYNNATHWQRKQFVYNEVKKDSSLTTDSTLNYFYNYYSNKGIGLIASVTDNIKQGDFSMSNSTNNGIVATNILEQNQQTVNSLILEKLVDANYVYTSADINTLYVIADQCPIAGGNAVYQARNLLMTITNDVIEFMDNCDDGPKRIMNTAKQNNIALSNAYKLYPNPNNGSMQLEYHINSNDIATIKIYDIAGKAICSYGLNASNEKLQINNNNLNSGVYFYDIIINNKVVKHDKLVIIK